LLEDPQAGANALKARLARFDRDTLVRLLSQRQDLTEEQIESTIDSIERSWFKVQNAPQKLTAQAQQQYEDAKNAIADYLRSTGKAELNPEGINKDLTVLLNNPKLGTKLIRRRLAAIDRDTLVQLLSQRDDLSEAQAEQIIDRVQATLRNLVKAPRRLAMRTQTTVRDFQSAVAEYLRSTEKEELNPEGIQRDFQLLLNDPRAGAESLQERLSKFDRDTLVQLLSQREDISQEDVNRIIDEILAVRDRTLAQLQLIQDKIKSVLDRVLATIRDYLNGLERPELNYYGIKQDLQTLFDDPQAGFEALKDRFSQLDRDTLIALLSSREDISQANAERLVAQVERSRDRMLQRAESIQNQAKMRLEQTKLQAQQQLEETRQAAATASWWLFFTALISAVASAGAGALGVID
jgi:predicted nucleic-acid-binding protein